jgi:PAS domain S-box-containing protein
LADELWRFFVEGVPDILLQVSSDGTILYVNRVLPGMSMTDIRGSTIYDHLQPAARPAVMRALADVFERAEMRYVDLPIAFDDGTVRWYAASAGPVIFGERVVAATMVARDMTEQKNAELALRDSEARSRADQRKLERQLAEFQKLDTLGHMAAGIAHDFNNILAIISASIEFLLTAIPPEDDRRSHVLEIRSAMQRGAALTHQILQYARQRERVPQTVDLNAAIEHGTEMLGRLLGPDIRIELHLHPDAPTISADLGSVDQILTNLLLNARDAMPSGGRIRIETAPVPDENAVLLRIADNGVGMDAARLPHIFEPFYTTKAAGQGTGLGLATTAMIVRRYGGRISVSSRVGEGSTFEIVLPASEPRAKPRGS